MRNTILTFEEIEEIEEISLTNLFEHNKIAFNESCTL
jgi:hypothetical protein